jgi:hypothetical protein
MQLEVAYVVEVTKLIKYVTSSKEYPLIQIVRIDKHIANSAMLRRVGSIARELHKGTRQVKDIVAEKKKERRQGKRIHGQFPRNLGSELRLIHRRKAGG